MGKAGVYFGVSGVFSFLWLFFVDDGTVVVWCVGVKIPGFLRCSVSI